MFVNKTSLVERRRSSIINLPTQEKFGFAAATKDTVVVVVLSGEDASLGRSTNSVGAKGIIENDSFASELGNVRS